MSISYLNISKEELEKLYKEFGTQQKHDQIKRDFCKNKGIKLLEIKYNEEVENKLENFFGNFKKQVNSML